MIAEVRCDGFYGESRRTEPSCGWQGNRAELLESGCCPVCGAGHIVPLTSAQVRVAEWARTTLGGGVASDVPERTLRAVEEAIELAQAVDVDPNTLHRLIDYVYSREKGTPTKEIAGCMVTLYAVASALGVDVETAFETELARIQTPEVIERVRRRQSEKREALAPEAPLVLTGDAATQAKKTLIGYAHDAYRPAYSKRSSGTALVDVDEDGNTKLPPEMVAECGRRIWFLRGKDRWETWPEGELEKRLDPHTSPAFSGEDASAVIDQLLTQLAGCGVAAMGGTGDQEAKQGDFGWSPAYADVLNLRRKHDALWQLLDDIDTLDDAAREHDDVFRERARAIQKKRWVIYNPDAPQ